MGYGDKLMAIGDAWVQHQQDPLKRRVMIGNGVTPDTQFPELGVGLDHFLAPTDALLTEDVTWIHSYPGHRPYIDYATMRARLGLRGARLKPSRLLGYLGHYIYNLNYRPNPAPIVLSPEEQDIYERRRDGGPFAIIEPFIKAQAPPSKQWPVTNFFEVGQRLMKDIPIYQFCPPGREPMTGFRPIYTQSFREALPHLKAASLFVGPEGGLHHASAATETPAVVIYGGFTSPLITGYPPLHLNLTGDNGGYACGTRYGLCPHCKRAFDSITPDEVLNGARRLLEAHHGR